MESIRKEYEIYGAENFYKNFGNEYCNPKKSIIKDLIITFMQKNMEECTKAKILDLCCGSGEVTEAIKEYSSNQYEIIGLDPYTNELYKKNTGNECFKLNFDDILKGKLQEFFSLEQISFEFIFCSFALHLCEESKLQQVLWQLSLICKYLIIITPHKRPDCQGISFELIETIKQDKCTLKVYKSKNYGLIG